MRRALSPGSISSGWLSHMWYFSWSLRGNFSPQVAHLYGALVTPSKVLLSLLRPCPVYTIFLISSRQSVTWKEKEETVRRVMVLRLREGDLGMVRFIGASKVWRQATYYVC